MSAIVLPESICCLTHTASASRTSARDVGQTMLPQ
jgi:hypothetical protein